MKPENHPQARSIFYEYLLAAGAELQAAVGKAPSSSKGLWFPPLKSISDVETAISHGRGIRWTLSPKSKPSFLVLDFDYHKTPATCWRRAYSGIIQYAIKNDLTLIRSSSGGLHLYFDRNEGEFVKKSMNRVRQCLIPETDFLSGAGGITGPSGSRLILHISSKWSGGTPGESHQYIPEWLRPRGKSEVEDKKIAKRRPDWLDGWSKGHRRRTLRQALQYFDFSDQSIREMNEFMCQPPKPKWELQKEVRDDRPPLANATIPSTTPFAPEDYDWQKVAIVAGGIRLFCEEDCL